MYGAWDIEGVFGYDETPEGAIKRAVWLGRKKEFLHVSPVADGYSPWEPDVPFDLNEDGELVPEGIKPNTFCNRCGINAKYQDYNLVDGHCPTYAHCMLNRN